MAKSRQDTGAGGSAHTAHDLHREGERYAMPYRSKAQERWAHTPAGTKALGGKKNVKEWDNETKGKKLPERVPKKK